MLQRIHLSILREVQTRGSLTAAADALCLTQSALSHAIHKLEEQLGVALWQREGRRLRLTQAGQFLLGVAQRVLPQLEQAEQRLRQYAQGERGALRIGMECHPCYQWLLGVVRPYLAAWPDVDVDVRQKFQFGGLGALLDHEIDLLVTPDPVPRAGLHWEPVFDYEQVLVVAAQHRLADKPYVRPHDLADETLFTYPVSVDRLDIFALFLLPAGVRPKRHKTIETTDILLHTVAAGRGVTALPRWLVEAYQDRLGVRAVRLGAQGLPKRIFLGVRQADLTIDYVRGFIQMARQPSARNAEGWPDASG
ncbi:LysR family transcriptional regulator [Tepidimonas charontis]|uniref:HTH-type transcriptional regulator MetR n=1 Tax=Tepidimonas charontis TaxID=2267262 RepID=A0A554X758_9BURK|nr:LysR family transcriptional regulator [Tepidimonas charontis]TSE31668.1 HTH-type transcriptional regulator MetR [Tepidimonas charontis]